MFLIKTYSFRDYNKRNKAINVTTQIGKKTYQVTNTYVNIDAKEYLFRKLIQKTIVFLELNFYYKRKQIVNENQTESLNINVITNVTTKNSQCVFFLLLNNN